MNQVCDFSGYFLISGFFFYKSPFASNFSWKKEVTCIVSKPPVSCSWWCGESANSRCFRGALSSRPKGDLGPLPIFMFVLLLSNHTPDECTFCINKYAVCGYKYAVCGYKYAVCGYKYAVCGYKYAVCGYKYAVCGYKYAVCGYKYAFVCGYKYAVCGYKYALLLFRLFLSFFGKD